MIEIRRAAVGDEDHIADLGQVTFRQAFGHLFRDQNAFQEYLDYTFSKEKIRSGIPKEQNAFWLVFSDELPVGYMKIKVGMDQLDSGITRSCQLQKIYILDDFHGRGIGKRLLGIAHAYVLKLGYNGIWLSVWDGNDGAIKIYEKQGYQTIDTYLFSLAGETFTFVRMEKELRMNNLKT